MQMSVFGAGYLGLTHAACMADLGHTVLLVDSDADRIGRLTSGAMPFYEPGLDELVEQGVDNGRLHFTTSYDLAAETADAHFICVGTPQRSNNHAYNTGYVDAVVSTLAPMLMRPCVVYGKSTVPVGTAERLAVRLRESAPAGADVELAWNPEFLREGTAIRDTMHPDRFVLGVDRTSSGAAEATLREIYRSILDQGRPLLVTDLATSELIKAAANAFLATKVSFINAMAELCDASGADITDLAEGIGLDRRIGRRFLHAGVGFGGGCLPKDLHGLAARAGELGALNTMRFLDGVDELNVHTRERVVALVERAAGGRPAPRIAVLGAAFKAGSDDIRDSPALAVADQLDRRGASVSIYDPMVMALEKVRHAFPRLGCAVSVKDACHLADAVVVLTEWPEFRTMDPTELGDVVHSKAIVDGRNCLSPSTWRSQGWTYTGVGRP